MGKLTAIIAFSIILLASCGEHYDFEKTIESKDGKISWGDQLVMEETFSDTTQKWDVLLDIEHSTSYPFQNVYLKFTTELPNGKVGEQVVGVDLADLAGKWQSDCGWGSCNMEVMLREKLRFTPAGKFKIKVEPYARQNPLEGIHSLKLKIRKTPAK